MRGRQQAGQDGIVNRPIGELATHITAGEIARYTAARPASPNGAALTMDVSIVMLFPCEETGRAPAFACPGFVWPVF